MKVLEFPLAKITIVFLLGILTAFNFTPNPNFVFGLVAILSLLAIIILTATKSVHKYRIYISILCYCIAFLTGISSMIIHTDSYQKRNYSNYPEHFSKETISTLTIREKLKPTTYHQRYIAEVQTINNKHYSGSILLHFSKDSIAKQLKIGSIVRINGLFQKNKKPENPLQFDYGLYLNKKQIYVQLYADSETLQISTTSKKDIWFYISRIRENTIKNIEKAHFEPTALHVATALILGQRQEVSPEIIQDYQYAGAIHILSVSGLHVGFIFLFLNFLLKPLPNTRKGSLIKLIVIIGSLSLFAIMAGLSASIVRSVTMFSFMAIGIFLRRNTNIYHTLLVSMLLLLLFQPYFLFDIGFQLSYLAVFFIVWAQPIFASYWKPKNKIYKYVWDLLTVSIAAQLGTLPLSLYNFHQFPGLFFITNLIVIPLISVIIFWGIVVFLLAAMGSTPQFMTKPFEWAILLLNKIINNIASLEQFIIKDIPFHFSFLLASYLLIISSIIWFQRRNINRLLLVLFSIIVLQSTILFSNRNIEQQEEWIVFNLKRKTLVIERKGKNILAYTNDSSITKSKTLNSYLIGNFGHIQQVQKPDHLLYFKGNKILVLDSLGIYPKSIQPDIVLLTQSPKINLDRMLNSLKPKLIIADGSNYQSILNKWKISCEKQKIPFHATAEKGFFQFN